MCKKKDFVSLKPFEISIGILILCWGFWFTLINSYSFIYIALFASINKIWCGIILISLGLLEIISSARSIFWLRRVSSFLIMVFFVIISVLIFSSPNSTASFTPAISIWLVVFCGIIYFLLGRCKNER